MLKLMRDEVQSRLEANGHSEEIADSAFVSETSNEQVSDLAEGLAALNGVRIRGVPVNSGLIILFSTLFGSFAFFLLFASLKSTLGMAIALIATFVVMFVASFVIQIGKPVNEKMTNEIAKHPVLFNLPSLGDVLEVAPLPFIEPILSSVLPKITHENCIILTQFQRSNLTDALTLAYNAVRYYTEFPVGRFYTPLCFKLMVAMAAMKDPIFIPALLKVTKDKSHKNSEVQSIASLAQSTLDEINQFTLAEKNSSRVEQISDFEKNSYSATFISDKSHKSIHERETVSHVVEVISSEKRRFKALIATGTALITTGIVIRITLQISPELYPNFITMISLSLILIFGAYLTYEKLGLKNIRKMPGLSNIKIDPNLDFEAIDDPALLSSLLSMTQDGGIQSVLGRKQRFQVFISATEILNGLNESSIISLSTSHKAILRQHIIASSGSLQIEDDPTHRFRLAILHAMPILGDASFVVVVQKLAGSKHDPNNPQIAELKTAAQECLPKLEALVERQKSSGTLLRASSINETEYENLLRAASGQEDSQPETLLRASDKPMKKPVE